MSKAVIERLQAHLGSRVLHTSDFRGDDEAVVAREAWREAAAFLRDDPETRMDHFIDITAVDYPEREPELPRFDVVLFVRSSHTGRRVRLRTRVADGEPLASLTSIYSGTLWGEREVWDMFGIPFDGHPDLRRILLYEEFVGHPLRKDYPIDRAQPLVPYRDAEDIQKLPPFGIEEGQPWGRIDWQQRLAGGDRQVSPSIALQTGQRRILSEIEDPGDQQSPPPTAGVADEPPAAQE